MIEKLKELLTAAITSAESDLSNGSKELLRREGQATAFKQVLGTIQELENEDSTDTAESKDEK